jgi:hypothetical protein
VHEVVRESTQALTTTLGRPVYARLSRWIEKQWRIERELHGSAAPKQAGPRSYQVFATRYDSNGAYTVALPDKCLKFANGGNHICDSDGYFAGAGYTVFISYEGATAAIVGESGPWNVDDNFWATSADPTPRRMFADLPLGVSEAQAAFFDGYNGGTDQFGREVTAPFGIDLARQVSIDIGLEPGKNDWITVSFMWTEGWDGTASSEAEESGGTAPAAPAAPTRATVIPIEISEANPDGSVVHEVKEGQTLWNIAAAYQVNLGEILRLNGMAEGSLIYPSQKLLVKPASISLTPTGNTEGKGILKIVPSATSRPSRSATPRKATQVAQVVPSRTPASQETPVVQALSNDPIAQTETDPVMIIIGGLVLAGVALLLFGQLFSRKT